MLRTHYARRSDQAVARRVDTLLAANDVFAALWREQRVEEIPMHVCTIVDPERGTLAMQLFAFTPVQSRDYTLIVLVPPFGTPAP